MRGDTQAVPSGAWHVLEIKWAYSENFFHHEDSHEGVHVAQRG